MVVRSDKNTHRRGAILVLSALLMVFLLIVVAFAIDTGYQLLTRTQIQSSVDSAVLAAAGALVDGKTAAQTQAYDYLAKNKVGQKTLTAADATLEFGIWDSSTRTFTVSNVTNPPALRMTATSAGHPTFFARVMGINNFTSKAKAVATYQPRDIVLALDYSGSMCDDSTIAAIPKLGKAAVEANMLKMYQDLGSPAYTPTYPYPAGSWAEYFNYCDTDSTLNTHGYRSQYNYITWLDYVQNKHPSAAETPVLWKTHEQPITAVKDAVNLFLAYLQSNSTDDQVGFSLYTYSDNKAKLETGLTKDFTLVNKLVRERQAGHYVGGTNIYDGLKTARLELQNHARVGSKKMIVLMTDGQANMPTGVPGLDKNMVEDEADLAAAANIPIVAISLGSGADGNLMQKVANKTGGAYFNIPGNQTVAQVQAQLEDVFAQVAADRPLKLVQ